VHNTEKQIGIAGIWYFQETTSVDENEAAVMDAVEVAAAAAAAAVMHECAGGDDRAPGERRERVLLRPWLENLIHSGLLPGLEWIDAGKTMFKVPWKHRSKKNWSLRHSSVFLVRLSVSVVSVNSSLFCSLSKRGTSSSNNGLVLLWYQREKSHYRLL